MLDSTYIECTAHTYNTLENGMGQWVVVTVYFETDIFIHTDCVRNKFSFCVTHICFVFVFHFSPLCFAETTKTELWANSVHRKSVRTFRHQQLSRGGSLRIYEDAVDH